jgi:hypothetical protein
MDIISTLVSCIICLLPIAIIVLLIIIATRNSHRNGNPTNQPIRHDFQSELLSWLKIKKSEGITTIDELIAAVYNNHAKPTQEVVLIKPNGRAVSELSRPVPQPVITPAPVQQKAVPHVAVPQQHQTPRKNVQISSAELLLYLGSFLVVFSLFVFIAFTWEIYSTVAKSLMIVIFTIAFYAVGAVLNRFERLKKASVTFVTIGTIASAFTGIGLWNFGLFENTSITFPIYWTVYGIVLAAVYFISLKIYGQKRYFYLGLLVLYSLMGSFSFMVTDDPKLRVVIIALLNVLFYGSDKVFGHLGKEIRIASRSVNIIFDILIPLIVLSLLPDISTLSSQVFAVIALLIPTIGYLLVWIKEKSKGELYGGILTLLVKISLIGLVFSLGTAQFALLMVLSGIILLTTCDISFAKEKQLINVLWVEHFTITLLTGLALFTAASLERTGWLQAVSIVLFVLPLIFGVYQYYKKKSYGFFSLELFIALFKALLIGFTFGLSILGYSILLLALFTAYELIQYYFIHRERALQYTSRAMSVLINGMLVIGAVSLLATEPESTTIRIIGFVMLLVPAVAVFLKSHIKYAAEHALELLLFPLKLGVIAGIIQLYVDTTIGVILTMLLIYAAFVTILALSRYKKHAVLKNLSIFLSWCLTGCVSLVLISIIGPQETIAQTATDFLKVETWLQVVLVVTSAAILLIPTIIRKNTILFSIALLYTFSALPWLTAILAPDATYPVYLAECIVVFAISTLSYLLGKMGKNTYFAPAAFLLSVFVFGFATILVGLSHGLGSLLISLIFVTLALHSAGYLAKVSTSKFLAVISTLATYLVLLGWLTTREILVINWPEQTGLALLIPGALYLVLSEIRQYANRNEDELLGGFLVFTALGFIMTLAGGIPLLVSLIALLVYSIYFLVRYQNLSFGYFAAILSYLIVLQSGDIWNWNDDVTALMVALLSTLYIVAAHTKITGVTTLARLTAPFARISVISSFILLLYSFVNCFSDPTIYITATACISAAVINSSERTSFRLRALGGIGYVLGIWSLASIVDAPVQLYILPLALYLVSLSWLYRRKGMQGESSTFEFAGFGIETSALFLQSVLSSTDGQNILYGIVLILLASLLIILGIQFKRKGLLALGIIFMALELLVRLSFVIVSIPWWIYLGLAGLGLIGSAIIMLSKAAKPSKE